MLFQAPVDFHFILIIIWTLNSSISTRMKHEGRYESWKMKLEGKNDAWRKKSSLKEEMNLEGTNKPWRRNEPWMKEWSLKENKVIIDMFYLKYICHSDMKESFHINKNVLRQSQLTSTWLSHYAFTKPPIISFLPYFYRS